jgi:hypothetical protein
MRRPIGDMRQVNDWLRGSSMYDPQAAARRAYEAYGAHATWTSVTGGAMPTWDDLGDAVRGHWRAAVEAVVGDRQVDGG